ncbi:MAG TPA: alcohol dehydrogenase catalytic domain-containing protein [Gaiellaceae bacterium]|nr:alcohol dehydrogenase catalytic domain-containing protein [Gaiellaceae bacterium]
MKALVVEPGRAGARVEDMPDTVVGIDEVPVRVLEVGVCGTDREIVHGLFGIAPEGEELLVLGHEALGVVERDGHGFSRGDLVSATVRRSCGHCLACEEASPDSCLTGNYSERGITRLHGFARELVGEDPAQLVPIPRDLRRVGVLAEPLSDCVRAMRHARAIGGRQPWELQRALVIGAGAIGTLVTFLLRLDGVAVVTMALEPARPLIEETGAEYVPAGSGDLGRFDLVVECAGNAQLMADALGLLRRSGVACLLGIDGREQKVELDGRTIGVDAVLENRVLFGSVNARREDWVAGIAALDEMRRRWPGVLDQLIGLRVPLDRFDEALAFAGGKATLALSD